MKPAFILIADDYAIVRRGLRVVLETGRNWKVAAEAANGREAVAQARKLHPDVAILDISMPQLNGLDACRLITRELPQTRVLIVAAHDKQDLIARVRNAGAQGFVLKADAPDNLIAAVEALLHGRTFFAGETSGLALQELGQTNHGGREPPLSARETEIIQLVVEGKSNKEVAATLGISTRTAENHRARVMRKLGLHSLSELVRYAVRNQMVEA
jgi:DNA-binding NarL/FixJ family response regulator